MADRHRTRRRRGSGRIGRGDNDALPPLPHGAGHRAHRTGPRTRVFPVAFFDIADEDAARTWLDGLLASEERSEGEDRAYPGAVAAHLHISLDGTKVLSFSEWLTEDQAVAHIEAVWAPVLKEFGGTGRLYRHFGTYVR
ncbi:hypothetical protein [Streptomyces sp. NBC_00120]|uniref:hypothetical protein n=1 Tax=Streptomyces sp. NBC_00120 TaxID=2975660 RepID=UPI002251D0F2|nr:hypothetical protein [Streptomyces sp. NBC_00120]MCX5320051.1 hypothetical protein [Streptomyces sp. NBC_00120]